MQTAWPRDKTMTSFPAVNAVCMQLFNQTSSYFGAFAIHLGLVLLAESLFR
jgi:hypothetical protein